MTPDDPRDRDCERRFREGLPFVEVILRWLARRFGTAVPFDEMRAYAHEALLHAARTYDPSRASLPTYVTRKVRWALLDRFRDERRSRRATAYASALLASERVGLDLAQRVNDEARTEEEQLDDLDGYLETHATALAMGLVTGGAGVSADDDTPEERTARAQMAQRMRMAIGVLPDRERALIERHYFGGDDFDEIAADLGISKSWASRLHAQALTTLASALHEEHEGKGAERGEGEARRAARRRRGAKAT